MLWFSVALTAYFLLGIAALIDKLIVTKYLTSPRVYMFLASVLGVFVVLLAPFGLEWPGWELLLLDGTAGAFFSIGLFFFYVALTRGEASRVVSSTDGLVPLVTLVLAYFFLQEQLTFSQLIAFLLLVSGTVVIAHAGSRGNIFLRWVSRIGKHKGGAGKWAVLAAGAFGTSFLLSKIVYETQSFISGMIWIRLGGALMVMPLLLLPQFRMELKKNFTQGRRATANTKIVLLGQGAGATGVLLQNYAIALGSVVLTTALQGLKYVFLFLFIALLGKKYKQLRENMQGTILAHKIIALVLIIAGLALLSFTS